MSKIISLSKIMFLEQFKVLFHKGSSGARKKVLKGLFAAILVALIMFSLGASYYSQHTILSQAGRGEFILYYAILNVVMILMILFTIQFQTSFFGSKDYELLASMPLKNHEIIISKFLAQLFNAYLFAFAALVPSLYFFFLSSAISFVVVLYLIIGFMLLPIFNLFLATVVSFAINAISNLFASPKKASNALSYIFMFVIIAGLMFVNFYLLGKVAQTGQIPFALKAVFPTAVLFFNSVTYLNWVNFLVFVAVSLGLLFLTIFILSKTYFKVNKVRRSAKPKIKKQVSFESKSVFSSLLKFEVKRFLSIPIYVINTSLGAMLALLASVAVPILYFTLVKGTPIEAVIMQKEVLLHAVVFISLIFGVMNCTTYASVSAEGQAFYFKKSLPITFKKNMLAKIGLNMLLLIPTFLLLSALLPFMIAVNFAFYEILLVFVLAFVVQLFSALFGLFANLLFIKLDWTNPTIMVKQSAPAFLFSVMLIAMIGGVSSFMPFVLKHISIATVGFALLGFSAMLSALFWFLILTVGKKKYKKAG